MEHVVAVMSQRTCLVTNTGFEHPGTNVPTAIATTSYHNVLRHYILNYLKLKIPNGEYWLIAIYNDDTTHFLCQGGSFVVKMQTDGHYTYSAVD